MQKRKTLVTKPLFSTRNMSTTVIGFEPKQYVPPAKVRVSRNTRAYSHNTQDAVVRLGPQMNLEDLKKYTKPEMGRIITKSTMVMERQNDYI
jgi:hypothetical protein